MNEKLMLLSLIPGLEAAKRAIDEQIERIKQEASTARGEMVVAEAPFREPRKRNIPEAVKEQRRKLLAVARLAKINKFRAEKGLPPKILDASGNIVDAPLEAPHAAPAKSRDGTKTFAA